jgi:hypothetical protein
MEMRMSALDVAEDEDLEGQLRVEPNGSVGWDKEAAFLRVCVDVSCFMSCVVLMMVVGRWGWCTQIWFTIPHMM